MEASLSRRFSDAWYGGRGGPHAVRERRSLFGACKGSIFPVADRAFDELATGGCAASANVDAPKSLSWQQECRLVGLEVERACPTCSLRGSGSKFRARRHLASLLVRQKLSRATPGRRLDFLEMCQ